MSARSQIPQAGGNVRYADEQVEAILRPHADELCAPGRHGWQQVKQNASRTVWRGQVAGHDLYVKHFHGRAVERLAKHSLGRGDALVELRFSQYLTQHGVPTIRALAAMQSGDVEWVATAAVPQAQPGDAWHAQQVSAGPASRRAAQAALVQLARMVGRMHAAGVLHQDLHCGNVLVRAGRPVELVLMDLHRMKARRRLSRRSRARNLAQLLHDRFDFTTRTERLRFLRHYLDASRDGGSLRTWQVLVEQFARPHARRQYANRDRRILHTDRYFTRLRGAGGWHGHAVLMSKVLPEGSTAASVVFERPWWQAALCDAVGRVEEPASQVVVNRRAVRVVRTKLQVGPHLLDVYIHRYRRRRWWKIGCDACRPSRAVHAFRLGHMLLARRVATALPLAAMERRTLGVLHESILITEAIEAPPLNAFVSKWLAPSAADIDAPQQRALAQEMLWQLGRLMQRLHDNGFAHRDLKAQNILVRWSPGHPAELVLVNLQGLRRPLSLTSRRRFQGLMRLNVSLLECPVVNHAGRLRMLLGYLRRPGMGRIDFKPHWRALSEWSERKLRRQIASRQRRQKAGRRLA